MEDRKGQGSLSNINPSDAGDTGTTDGTITNTGMPTGQGGTGGAGAYPAPGQAADRGDGRAGNTPYGTGADMPGTGGDSDLETMADDVNKGASRNNKSGADTNPKQV